MVLVVEGCFGSTMTVVGTAEVVRWVRVGMEDVGYGVCRRKAFGRPV